MCGAYVGGNMVVQYMNRLLGNNNDFMCKALKKGRGQGIGYQITSEKEGR